MASLKEIKDRINSVNGTLKITSAMKMVATSKLRKAQGAIGNLLPYERQMHRILADLLTDGSAEAGGIYMAERPLKKAAIVAFASNTSLCGAFNSNAVRHFSEAVGRYKEKGLSEKDIIVFPIGKKMADAVSKMGFTPEGDYNRLADKPSYGEASALAARLMDMFTGREVDRIELVYTHCKSAATQIPVHETYLPVSLDQAVVQDEENDGERQGKYNFIVEPDPSGVLETLLPKVLYLKIYAVLLDANAAEHAARMMAMQLATDNGNELLEEIRIQYNKQRQQEITNELQDIIGGTLDAS